MKVVYITLQFPSPSETFACNDVRTLKHEGVDVSVYSMKPAHSRAAEMVQERKLEDIPIISCGIRENIAGLFSLICQPFLFFSLLRWVCANEGKRPRHLVKEVLLFPASFYLLKLLRKQPPQILHLFWGHYPSLIGYLVKKINLDTKISMFLGAYDLTFGLGISRDLACQADFLFTHAKVNLPALKSLGVDPRRVTVVYRGVDDSLFGQLKLQKDMHNNERPVIACIGRLVEDKGVQKSIAIIHHLQASFPSVRLYVAGEGPYRSTLEGLVKELDLGERVSFLGHISHNAVFDLLGRSDFFLLMTTCSGERLPNVIKEAMLCGAVPVTSESPGI